MDNLLLILKAFIKSSWLISPVLIICAYGAITELKTKH